MNANTRLNSRTFRSGASFMSVRSKGPVIRLVLTLCRFRTGSRLADDSILSTLSQLFRPERDSGAASRGDHNVGNGPMTDEEDRQGSEDLTASTIVSRAPFA